MKFKAIKGEVSLKQEEDSKIIIEGSECSKKNIKLKTGEIFETTDFTYSTIKFQEGSILELDNGYNETFKFECQDKMLHIPKWMKRYLLNTFIYSKFVGKEYIMFDNVKIENGYLSKRNEYEPAFYLKLIC